MGSQRVRHDWVTKHSTAHCQDIIQNVIISYSIFLRTSRRNRYWFILALAAKVKLQNQNGPTMASVDYHVLPFFGFFSLFCLVPGSIFHLHTFFSLIFPTLNLCSLTVFFFFLKFRCSWFKCGVLVYSKVIQLYIIHTFSDSFLLCYKRLNIVPYAT